MARKNLKVSEIVHEELESKKRQGDTFDDVLKRELGLVPNLDELSAYFPDPQRDTIDEVVQQIEKIADVERRFADSGDSFVIEFVSTESGRTLAELSFDKNEEALLSVSYRHMSGKMEDLGGIWPNAEEVHIETMLEKLPNKIEAAEKRWG